MVLCLVVQWGSHKSSAGFQFILVPAAVTCDGGHGCAQNPCCCCHRACPAVLQVRAFDNDEVVHVDDSVDPVRDLETIQVGGLDQVRGGI